jgi:hypothetical protein
MATNMNHHGCRQQNTKIPQVEAALEPVTPAPALLPPAAPAPVPVIPAAAATTTAAATIATALHRPRRQWQLPQRFRQDNTATPPDDGEWIDLNNVSSGEDKDDPPEVIVNSHTHPCLPQTMTSTLLTNPFATRKRGLKSTSDVQFFFRKTYIMFNCLRFLQQVTFHLIRISCSLMVVQVIYKLTPMEWQVLQDLEVILEVCFKMSKVYNSFTVLH